jgi:hypothetical protein
MHQREDKCGQATSRSHLAVRPTILPFSDLVPSVSEDPVRCNGGLAGGAPGACRQYQRNLDRISVFESVRSPQADRRDDLSE